MTDCGWYMDLLYIFLIGAIIIFSAISLLLLVRLFKKRREKAKAPQPENKTTDIPIFMSEQVKERLSRFKREETEKASDQSDQ